MKTTLKILLFACFVTTILSLCFKLNDDFSAYPEVDDRVMIQGVIQNYFDGWLTGDTTLIGSAMHESCHLKFIRDGEVDKRNRNQYLSNFKPRPRLENSKGRIIDIDITRTAASAKVELEIPSKLFTDYFNLLKVDNRWYITDKVSTSIIKN